MNVRGLPCMHWEPQAEGVGSAMETLNLLAQHADGLGVILGHVVFSTHLVLRPLPSIPPSSRCENELTARGMLQL